MIEVFRAYRENRHQEAKNWKEQTGGKVLGIYCCNVPEEMIHAAGILPVRILGDQEETTEADLHFPINVCPYLKRCFDQALKGRYDYLDGVVVPNVCNMVRNLYSFSKAILKIPHAFFLETPQAVDSESVTFFKEELDRFKEFLEDVSGKEISAEALTNSVAVYNENRGLLTKMDELKRSSTPLLSGAEAQEIVLSSMLMPKEKHNQMLAELLEQIASRRNASNQGVRLFVSAGMFENTDLFRLIEDCGGNVVADDIPTGSRYFYHSVDSDREPLAALAERYVNKIPCPRKMLLEARLNYVDEVMNGAEVRGVIIHNLRACDPHLYEYPLLKAKFEQQGLPVLYFKGEEKPAEREEQRNDLESFIEMLGD